MEYGQRDEVSCIEGKYIYPFLKNLSKWLHM